MYAYRITEALPASTQVKASILPALDVSNVVHWFEPNGTTRTGQLQTLELIDGIWWGAALYELIPGNWVLENRHAFNFFPGVGPEFALQLHQKVWFKRGNIWQAAKVSDFYLECHEWFAVVQWGAWYGKNHDELPVCEIRTTQPEVEDRGAEFVSKADFWADYEYEDRRDNR